MHSLDIYQNKLISQCTKVEEVLNTTVYVRTFAMQLSRPPVCGHGMFYFVYTCCDFIASILFAVYRCNYCMALTVIILMLPYGRFN